MSSNVSIVLVYGAWSTPAHYAKLITALKAAGLDVHCPELPSVNGARPPTADLEDDTRLIRAYVEDLVGSGRIVVAVLYSYSRQGLARQVRGNGADSLLYPAWAEQMMSRF